MIPLSFSQLRFWFQNEMSSRNEAPVSSVVLRLSGDLDTAALEAALRDVVVRHESLRTVFPSFEGIPRQVVLDPDAVSVTLPERRTAAQDLSAAIADALAPAFNLSHEMPLRALLLTTAPLEHVLVVAVHHIAFDGWSLAPFLRDLSAAYRSRLGGHAPPEQELPVQYRDFTQWQRDVLGSKDDPDSLYAQQLAYWRSALDGLPEELTLPADRPRPTTPSHRAGAVPFRLGPETRHRLTGFAREQGVSVFMVFHAALAGLLTRWGAGTDLPIGSPVAGRTDAALEDLVGCFVNTVVVRADTSGDPTFVELVARARAGVLAALDHQDAPFEQVVEAVNPVRSAARHPLFQVMLSLQNNAAATARLPGLDVAVMEDRRDRSTPFDLLFDVTEVEEGFEGRLVCAEDLFDHATARILARHFERFVTLAVTHPDRRIARFEIMSRAETEAVLRYGRGDAAPVPSGSVPALLRRLAADRPDALAVICEKTRLTHGELETRADRLARRLLRHGAGPERLVAVAMERSAGLIVALLAVLKTGAAYLPLDPRSPDSRLRTILEEAMPCLLLTDEKLHERGAGLAASFPDLTVLIAADGQNPPGPSSPLPPLTADHAAYAMYTSGSTGRPKGVLVTHGNILALAADPAWQREGHTRVLAHSPHSFDASTYEVWVPLLRGGTVVVAPPDASVDALAPAVAEHQVSSAFLTASLFDSLVAENSPLLGRLRHVWTGGEEPSPSAMRAMLDTHAGTSLTHVYGPTENTTFTTSWHVDPAEWDGGKPPIGRPLANTQVYVLDDTLTPVPAGVTGELYLAGTGLARGYLNQPALTAERFTANPYGPPGTRMYRTGDLARWTPHGQLHFLGRTDTQIKIRGHRIEPTEIETALTTHPAITQAAVTLHNDPAHTPRLTAYVVPTNPHHDTHHLTRQLTQHARHTLPDYMIPTIVPLPQGLPLTPNGKLDHQALPTPQPTTTPTTPRTPTETLICQLFAETLNLPHIGIHDNFFELGGHSLLAIRLVSRMRAVLGAHMDMRAVFEAPTPAELAERFSGAPAGHSRLTPRSRPEVLPLSYPQLRFWLLGALADEGGSHTITTALRFSGHLDVPALRDALGDVVGRHESLRTVFPVVDGVPRQQVLDAEAGRARVELPVRHVSDDEVPQALASASSYVFALAQEPPLRAELLAIRPDTHVLLVTVHHMVFDGWSAAPFLRDLSHAYSARCDGEAPAFAPLPVQYADFTLWQRDELGTHEDPDSVLTRQLSYWEQRLAGLPDELTLPADRPRPAIASRCAGTVALRLSPQDYRSLTEVARDRGATAFMALHAGLAGLLARLGAGTDIAVGSPVAGRSDVALDELVGCFLNTVVVRTDTGGNPSFADLIDRVRATVLSAFEHQDVPFERVVEAVNPARSAARHPLFQVMLSLQNNATASAAMPGVQVTALHDGRHRSVDLDLIIDVRETDEGLAGSLVYAEDLFDRTTAERLARCFERFLAASAAAPDRPVARTEIMSPAERTAVLEEWNTGAGSPAGESVVRRFRRQAALTPDAVAVTGAGTRLTYAELDARADRLARHLLTLGGGPERPIAVVMDRSPDLVVALLAVHRTGAPYLPVDPRHPRQRIHTVLADAAPDLVLTDLATREAVGEANWLALDDPRFTALDTPSAGHPALYEVMCDAPAPASAAYVIHTSGSTGGPKGVTVTHVGLANVLDAMHGLVPLTEDDRLLAVTTVAFDIAQLELLLPLLHGAGVVIASADEVRDPLALAGLVHEHAITVIQATPTLLSTMVHGATEAVRGLRVLVGGEALPSRLAGDLCSLSAEVTNVYGPTEATIWSLAAPVTQDNQQHPPIGRPLANTQVYVLDDTLTPVPAGVTGELYLAGTGLARGYLNQPALTAERFTANPYGPPGTRMYRTGDLARWTPHGQLHFLGRTDTQIKIRGHRIEPTEIETALTTHPAITQAAVTLHNDPAHTPRLTAYVVPTNPHHDTHHLTRQLTQHARHTLPDYMIPTIVPLPQGLPLTPNGKLDHQALPTPQPTTTPTTPRTPTETLICQLFAETLNLPHIGIHDNFFELGGDSIVAIRLVARARSRGVRISARDVFRHQTVAALAEHAQVSGQQASAGTPGEASGPTGRAEPRTELPPADAPSGPVVLTPILRWRHDSGGPVDGFHQSVLVRTPAGLGLPRLHRMLQALLDRHDALRTRWETTADWRLEVLPRGAVPASACLTRVDATGAGDEALRNMVAAHADEARRQLAPGRGRMLQGVWFDAGPDRPGRLLLLINHLVVDGVSWRILLQDLRTAWDLFKEHVPGAEPGPAVPTDTWVTERMANPPVSFEEWGRLLAANARERTGELSFWTGLFEGVGDVVDGADLVAGRDVLRTQATVSRVLPADLTEDLLNRAPTATGTGINAVLLTALGEAVHRWRSAKVPGNTKPFLVDIEGHGREEIAEDLDLSSTVGWFTSMFPVRLECHPGAPERTMAAVHDQLVRMRDHGLGFGLLRYLNPETAPLLARLRRPQILFNYLGRFDRRPDRDWELAPEAEAVGGGGDPDMPLTHLLEVSAIALDRSGRPELTTTLAYPTSLLSGRSVQALADLWCEALQAAAARARKERAIA